MGRANGGFFSRVIPGGTVGLFAHETETVPEALTSLYWGEVEGINVHGVLILHWLQCLRTIGGSGAGVLCSWALMD